MGSGLGAVALVTSGVGQGKESSEESLGRALLVVYGVCAAWSDRLVGIRVCVTISDLALFNFLLLYNVAFEVSPTWLTPVYL